MTPMKHQSRMHRYHYAIMLGSISFVGTNLVSAGTSDLVFARVRSLQSSVAMTSIAPTK